MICHTHNFQISGRGCQILPWSWQSRSFLAGISHGSPSWRETNSENHVWEGHNGVTGLHPWSPCVSTLPVGGGCGLSPTLSRSLGTSCPQLKLPMALPSTGRVGVGNRVCTGTGLGPWCSGGGSSVHTRPMGENPEVPEDLLKQVFGRLQGRG